MRRNPDVRFAGGMGRVARAPSTARSASYTSMSAAPDDPPQRGPSQAEQARATFRTARAIPSASASVIS